MQVVGGLEQHIKSSKLSFCYEAVNQVVHGEIVKNGWTDKELWKLKIVTTLMAKLQQSEEGFVPVEDWTVARDENYFEAVTMGLPAFNNTFVFDIVKHCRMSTQLCQVGRVRGLSKN